MKHNAYKSIRFKLLISILFLCSLADLSAQEVTYSGFLTDGVTFVDIHVKNGLIESISTRRDYKAEGEKIYISPGLIDTQVNGYASVSFNTSGLTDEKLMKFAQAMWKEGVTTFFPTIVTNSSELIIQNLKILTESMKTHPELAHSIPGFFLEGPYISPDDGYRGAHNRQYVRPPDWEEFSRFYDAAEGHIIQIGVAPESKGAMDFIKKCLELGVIVSLAHHNATASQIEEAVSLGARVSTHIGNGCANMIHRHDNPIWPQLANDELTPSIIADGHHLRKEELKVFFKVKGPENLMLVSDATELAGMPPGTYNWNGKEIVMTEDGMLQYPAQNVLAGASFPVRTGVKNMINLVGCTLNEAVQMASKTPAMVYQLMDRGEIWEGMSADLILFKLKDNELIIQETVLQGKVVYYNQ